MARGAWRVGFPLDSERRYAGFRFLVELAARGPGAASWAMSLPSSLKVGRRLRRRVVWERGGGVCHLCNAPVALKRVSLDHVIPRSYGGGDELGNLRPSHRACNSRRGNRLLEPLPEGWPMPTWATPSTAPPPASS